MTIQFEKTKTVLELLKLEVRTALERLEETLSEIIQRERKLEELKQELKIKGATDGRNS